MKNNEMTRDNGIYAGSATGHGLYLDCSSDSGNGIIAYSGEISKHNKKCTHEHVSRGICLYCNEELKE